METFSKYIKTLTVDNKSYDFVIKKNENNIFIKIEQKMSVRYYTAEISHKDYEKFFVFYDGFDEDFFIDFLVESINNKEFKMENNEKENKILNFWIELGKGKFSKKQNFFIELESKLRDIPNRVEMIFEKVEEINDSFKSNEAKIRDLNSKFEGLNLSNENSSNLIQEKFREFEEFQKLILEKFDLFRKEIAKMDRIQLPLELSVFENNFIRASNENKTFEFISNTAWKGIRGNPIPNKTGCYKFSIKIDNCSANCYINIGFCLSSHSGANGFYNGNCLGMIYLSNGTIYCPSLGNVQLNFRGTKGMIITATIDTEINLITFYANGSQLVHPRSFTISENDKIKICPCIDLGMYKDKVSLIEY